MELEGIQMKMLVTLFLLLVAILPTAAQDSQASLDTPSTWLFDSKFGSEVEFGNRFSTTVVGITVERPFLQRFEVQGNLSLLPQINVNNYNGHAFGIAGTGIGWINQHVGVSGSLEHNWLWTPQVDKSVWNPSLGVVFRDELYRPGRLYVNYMFPTGCATAGQGCLIPSDRTQGLRAAQEFRVFSHVRLGFQTGIFHLCNESPSDTGNTRSCHWGVADMFVVRFEVHSTGNVEPY
jgi:hypothetical protein